MSHLAKLLPRYGYAEYHSIVVHAPPTMAYAAVKAVDIPDSGAAKAIVGLWHVLARLLMRKIPNRSMRREDFILLAEQPLYELVVGLVAAKGQKAFDNGLTARDFAAFQGPGFKLAWSFAVTPQGDDTTLVETETRVLCCDAGTASWFWLYWLIIRPWSGLIRRDLLRLIRRRAEANSLSS